jgi:two-component system chemotaxis response regulator CheY
MKALVVDSSKTMRSVLRRILSMRGFEVEEADDYPMALDVLRRIGIADVVLVNWNLAEVDCLEFVTGVRQESSHDTLVIMMVASEPGRREVQRALVAGANDYLLKPFNSLQVDNKLASAGLLGDLK